MSLQVIANPHAGHGRGAHVLGRVEAELRKRGVAHSIALSRWAGHAVQIATQAARVGATGLVLVGGDGTMFEALNGMQKAGRMLPVAQVPIGTGNSFIKDLGIESTDDGLAALHGGRTRKVDIGVARSSAGECRFANIVGAGFVADVAARAGSFKRLGDASYTIGVLIEVARLRSLPCRIRADGRLIEREAIFVEVCNSRKTGGNMIMAPRAVLDDGVFDVVIATAMNRRTLLGLFPLIFTGEHVNDPHVETFTCSRLDVEFDPPQRVTPDGELLGSTPLSVEVLPRALEVFTL